MGVGAAPHSSDHRRLWAMAGPIILSNVSVPLLGMVDTAVMGHLAEPYYIGAVAIGAMIFNFIYHGFNCLRMGTTGPTAQARGAGSYAEVRALAGRSLFLAAVIGVSIVALQVPVIDFAFWAIDASPEVESLGREYFLIRVWAMPAVLGTYAIIGWLYGLLDARVPLVLQLVTNGINIVLDFLFVFGFGWDVAGVATASVIAEYCGLLLGLFYMRRALRRLPAGEDDARLFDAHRMRRMIAINTDIFLRTMCVVSAFAVFMAKSATLGDVTLAANQILHHFLIITSFGLDGIAHAAEAILGESAGRRKREEFARGVRMVLIWAGFVGLLNVLVYAAAGSGIIALMTSIPAVQEMAGAFLPWAVLMPLVSTWAYTYDGIYLAATRTKAMRNSMLFSFVLFLALQHFMLPAYGNPGLWGAVAVFMAARGVTLFLYYPRLLRGI